MTTRREGTTCSFPTDAAWWSSTSWTAPASTPPCRSRARSRPEARASMAKDRAEAEAEAEEQEDREVAVSTEVRAEAPEGSAKVKGQDSRARGLGRSRPWPTGRPPSKRAEGGRPQGIGGGSFGGAAALFSAVREAKAIHEKISQHSLRFLLFYSVCSVLLRFCCYCYYIT
ncbi:uncharacterized protein LOC125041617 [Penaeus chinensis]|uniref:uncharacterized protein LOC125041617 n=1 Tax=Penaeus chinensis TaxID=139456 RepID=UPI001FB65AC6|nr:uncharacterized protein LOC125041617 [Penaeus chinensis]